MERPERKKHITDMSNTVLPGIKRIGWIDSARMEANAVYNALAGKPVTVFSTITWMTLVAGDASLTLTTNEKNNGTEQTAKLKFRPATPPPGDRPLVFVAETVDGDCRLIGAGGEPHAKIKAQYTTGSQKSPAGWEVEVTHTALRTGMRCKHIQ